MATDELSNFEEEMQALDEPVQQEFVPSYKMFAGNKIAISKKEGTLWHERIKYVEHLVDKQKKDWLLNIDTYLGKTKAKDAEDKQLRLNGSEFCYENLVWANTLAINRQTIMKLPTIQITAQSNEHEQYVVPLEHALNKLLGSVGNNGINMKEKLKKADIGAQLTNRGIIRLDWNTPIDADEVMHDIRQLEQQLANPELSLQKIKDIEGKLFALNEQLESSGMSGLQFSLVDPSNLLIDPNSQLETGLDADWIIERRVEYKSVIEAKYGTKEGTVYAGSESDIGSEQKEKELPADVFDDNEQKIPDCMQTVVTYYVWDKIKKRVYLYEDGRWDYPLWVWEDPYKLIQFFPYFILSYNLNPYENSSLPECSYYMSVQNQINDINSQIKKARDRAFNIVLYDKRGGLDEKDLQNLTNGKTGYVGLNLPEGKRLQDVMSGMPTFGTEFQPLMDKSGLYAMMQKMSSADATSRGEEYRTNTTNMAIEQYGAANKVIIGIRVDAIISFYMRIVREVCKIALENFGGDEWSKLLNSNESQFILDNPIQFDMLDVRFDGDDTIEPTSAVKKQEAMQLAQVMGQFAGASPAVTVVMLKVLGRAFNEVVMNEDDWQMIYQGIQQQMMAQQQGAQAQQPPAGPQQPAIPEQQMPPQEDMINQAAMMEG